MVLNVILTMIIFVISKKKNNDYLRYHLNHHGHDIIWFGWEHDFFQTIDFVCSDLIHAKIGFSDTNLSCISDSNLSCISQSNNKQLIPPFVGNKSSFFLPHLPRH